MTSQSQLNLARRIRGRGVQGTQRLRERVYITHLPSVITTLDIYNSFSDYGTIVYIKILENPIGGGGLRAEIEYEPPAEESTWPRKVKITTQGMVTFALATLSKLQPDNMRIQSPIHKGVDYDAKMELLVDTIHFGVLLEPNRMLSLASRSTDEHRLRITLDLKRKLIEVVFPSMMESDNRQAVRIFRFHVPLDEDFDLWKLPDDSYILHLVRPPWYSKQLKEAMAQSHAEGAKRWSIEDTWARQTDLVSHKNDIRRINDLPVSLRKDYSAINISRWTTFKFDISQTERNVKSDKIMQNALRDFNVSLMSGSDFVITQDEHGLEQKIWSILNPSLRPPEVEFWDATTQIEDLPFSVRYQLEVCISHGWLSEYSMTGEFIETLADVGPAKAKQILLHLDAIGEREWYPMQLFKNLRYQKPVQFRHLPMGCMEIRSAVVTATGILFNSPTVEQTNRIIRKYEKHVDYFLRVRFEDDISRGRSRLYADSNKKMVQVFHRVRRVLRNGIKLGNVHYEFLAWGNSQLREHGAYFFAEVDGINAEMIRADMGAFDKEKVVAKRAARMGQCFSTTRTVHLIVPTITEETTIPDICENNYNFTDGVGKISTVAAQMIHLQLDIKGPVPSAFQFRLGGCKGVLVVWPDMTGVDVKVRASQFKFSSSSNELEVIRWSEFWQPFLNRQIIVCLSDLGIPAQVFLQMQDKTIADIGAALTDDTAALKALRDTVDPNTMTLSICELVEAGFRGSAEPFVMSLLHLWRAWMLKFLKEKAKIPVSKGAFVLGCGDETQSLRGHINDFHDGSEATTREATDWLPEIFLQINSPQSGRKEIITGTCILARNPSLHRGDIRVVLAVDNPNLHHLCDVVVMPTCGDRDLPSMCSGGDLDGDDYIVIWDPALIPETWNAKPFHYEAPPAKKVEREITTADIINFFYDYLQNDYLGRIAHAHLAAADFLDEGIQSKICEELVQLHSMAVDYPKTGVPAIMRADLHRTIWPHFMEKKGGSYKSRKVLGQLYDAVEKVAFEPKYDTPFSEALLNAFDTKDELRDNIKILKKDYDCALQRIMARHDIKTEFEVFSTFVLSHSKAYAEYKFHEEIGNLSRALKEQYRHALAELAGGSTHDQLAPVAVAAYQYTNAQVQVGLREIEEDLRLEGYEGMPFISFPWLLQDTLCWLASKIAGNPSSVKANTSEPHLDVNSDCQDIHKWLATIESDTGVTTKGQTDLAIQNVSASVENDGLAGLNIKNAMKFPSLKDPLVIPDTALCDPLNISSEKLKEMGFNEDMELED